MRFVSECFELCMINVSVYMCRGMQLFLTGINICFFINLVTGEFSFSNSLIIHQVKTRKSYEIWIPGLN